MPFSGFVEDCRFFLPTGGIIGTGAARPEVGTSPFQSIYIFYCNNCFYFLNCIVLCTVIVFPTMVPVLGGLWLTSDLRSVGLFLAHAMGLCRLLACCHDGLFPAGFRTIDIFTSLPWPYRLLYTPALGRRVGRTQMEESKTLGCGSLNVYE